MLGSAAIGHPQSCPAPDRPRLYAVQPSPGSPLVYYCIEIQPTIRPTLFHPPQFRPTRNVGEWEQSYSRAAPATAELFSCTVQTRPRAAGSRQPQKTGWNYLIFYTARPRRLLTLSSSSPPPLSLASFAFYTGRSFAQFFLVSGLPLCPLCRGVNELSREVFTIISIV